MTGLTATPILVTENWDEQKEKLKTSFSPLTDEERGEMLDRVGTRLAKIRKDCGQLHLIKTTAWSLYILR